MPALPQQVRDAMKRSAQRNRDWALYQESRGQTELAQQSRDRADCLDKAANEE